ncbi:MAG TPA: hypothetical protein VFQ85_09820 [Mycobacteriales bacterium]|jgi:hypothetical protein|nr:hypothetical protein [Mycobacteriales bacterium]
MSRTLARLGLAAAVATSFLGSAAPAAHAAAAPCPGYISIEEIRAPAYANCMVDWTIAVTIAELGCVTGFDPLTPATLANVQSETAEYAACAA